MVSPSLTDAVHWLIDDTWLDTKSSAEQVGRLFVDTAEAAAVDAAVSALLVVLDALGPVRPDSEYLVHPNWPAVIDASRFALATLDQ